MSANLNTKVFVGNLSYKTSKQDLASHFSSVGGVVNANIISRGNRSMGYGFVEFDSEATAQKAISVLNHQSIDGREINVELAKPREEGEPAADRGSPRGRGRGGRGRGAPRGTFQPRGAPGQRHVYRGAPSRGGPAPAAPSTAPAPEVAAANGAAAPATAPAPAAGGPPSPVRGRGAPRGRGLGPRGGGVPLRGAQRGAYPGYFARGGGPFRGRGAPRRPIRAERGQRESSSTTLYVNNLPFKLEDNDLKEIFKEYKVVSAHVVANKYNGRKKGYGFVELENQEEQNKALNLNNTVVEGRKIGVRVAFKEVKKEELVGEKTAEETNDKEKKEVKKEGETK